MIAHEKHAKINAVTPGVSASDYAPKTSLRPSEICGKDGSAEAEIIQADRRTL
jgi:hypothetical protein